MKKLIIFCFTIILLILLSFRYTDFTPYLKISENKRFLITETGKPFFWLGDTGWLLFTKLNRQEAEKYFEDRHQKGFNVIQAIVLHNIKNAVNTYGDSALINYNIDQPFTTSGNSPDDSEQYDYWDHIDYIINLASTKGLYIALVPIWGSNIKSGNVTKEKVVKYITWLVNRYKDKPNIIWINGGDIKGSDSISIWKAIGKTIRKISPKQLITFHPFGRTQSSDWFHEETWLDFNMFQSGHRRYDQDTTGKCYGEDNWKYVVNDYSKFPVKPTLDGEPSYEDIPQGLHDPSQPYWTNSDVRRYAYWSVFAGACGFTYGHNAVMQFHKKDDKESHYGVKDYWEDALDAPGASQIKFLKQLMLSRSYFDRIPAQDILFGSQGEKYDYIIATRGNDYAFIYTYNGNVIKVNLEKLKFKHVKASWFNPRNGSYILIGTYKAKGIKTFNPPGKKENGNDWVLVLDSA